MRPYPLADPQDGLHEEDLDGDGRILMMRLPDPNGAWKPHPDEPRLLVRRDPVEEGGEYYRVLWEGAIRNYDGVTIKLAAAGRGPRHEPELPDGVGARGGVARRRLATRRPSPRSARWCRRSSTRPNITGHIAYHTFSGVHLRPYASYADDHFPTDDLRAYRQIGEEATRITGYPAVSVYHDFKYDPKTSIKGSAHDWLYDHMGVFSWTTEFWSPQRRAGIEDYHFIEWLRDHPPEDDLKLLRWAEQELGERAYVDWYPYEHPQLGAVELGGWDMFFCWANVPPHLLEAEVAPHSELAIWHLLISPRLELHSLEVDRVGETAWAIRLVVHNTGWLPTQVTDKAAERNMARPLEVELTLPEGARLRAGELRTELGQLQGRVHKRSLLGWWSEDSTTERAKAEWVVEAPEGGTVAIEARHGRAGVVRLDAELR